MPENKIYIEHHTREQITPDPVSCNKYHSKNPFHCYHSLKYLILAIALGAFPLFSLPTWGVLWNFSFSCLSLFCVRPSVFHQLFQIYPRKLWREVICGNNAKGVRRGFRSMPDAPVSVIIIDAATADNS